MDEMDSMLCKTESLCRVCENNVEGRCALEETLNAYMAQLVPEMDRQISLPLAAA